jgi:hypothetical protein
MRMNFCLYKQTKKPDLATRRLSGDDWIYQNAPDNYNVQYLLSFVNRE